MPEVNADLTDELLKNALKGLKAIHDEVQTVNGLIRLSNEAESNTNIKHDTTNKVLSSIDSNLLVTNELLSEIADAVKVIKGSCAILTPTLIRLLNCLEKYTGEKGNV